jgi:mono/diheme cytochrome c family protein
MDFLFYQAPYWGNGMIIGLNASLHVVLSHGVAIGLTAYIVLTELLARRRDDPGLEALAAWLLKPAVILITGAGALTGVGIWFTTSALAPAGIASLLRVFFWPWFAEWVVFFLEVVVILFMHYRWAAWSGPQRGKRVTWGVVYVLLTLGSAIIISGILGFMITPDGWVEGRGLWQAFFNQTYLPQVLLRLGMAAALGAVMACAFTLVSGQPREVKQRALAIYGKGLLLALPLVLGLGWWYFSAVPWAYKTHALFAVLTSHFSQRPGLFWLANALALALPLLLGLAAWRGKTGLVRLLAPLALLAAVGLVGEFERVREFIRGPYLMPGYMYANQVCLEQADVFRQEGMLPHSWWFNATLEGPPATQAGAFLFAQNCSGCHTINGINGIQARVAGRTQDGIAAMVAHTMDMVPYMPPFAGSDQERELLAQFLHGLGKGGVPAPSHVARYTPYQGQVRP